jgi:pimeloyl-ACP methyl ester carboxylesterase
MLLGHSIGGAIAALALASDAGFARRVILEDPALDSVETERLLRDSPEPMANPTTAAVAAEHPEWHPRDVELKVEALLQCGPEVASRTMEDSSPWDLWDEVKALQVPTLLLAADPGQGALVSAQRGAEVAAVNPAVKFVLLEGASHSMHRDAFDRFFERVRRFIAG